MFSVEPSRNLPLRRIFYSLNDETREPLNICLL